MSYIPIIGKSTLAVSNAVSGNAKQGSGQPMESATTKKCKGEPQTGISTLTQDAEQAAPPTKKKKTTASTGLAQPSTVVTVVGSNYSAPSNMIKAKKCPSQADNDASIDGNPVTPHPKKKTKFDGLAALSKVLLHHTGNC